MKPVFRPLLLCISVGLVLGSLAGCGAAAKSASKNLEAESETTLENPAGPDLADPVVPQYPTTEKPMNDEELGLSLEEMREMSIMPQAFKNQEGMQDIAITEKQTTEFGMISEPRHVKEFTAKGAAYISDYFYRAFKWAMYSGKTAPLELVFDPKCQRCWDFRNYALNKYQQGLRDHNPTDDLAFLVKKKFDGKEDVFFTFAYTKNGVNWNDGAKKYHADQDMFTMMTVVKRNGKLIVDSVEDTRNIQAALDAEKKQDNNELGNMAE